MRFRLVEEENVLSKVKNVYKRAYEIAKSKDSFFRRFSDTYPSGKPFIDSDGLKVTNRKKERYLFVHEQDRDDAAREIRIELSKDLFIQSLFNVTLGCGFRGDYYVTLSSPSNHVLRDTSELTALLLKSMSRQNKLDKFNEKITFIKDKVQFMLDDAKELLECLDDFKLDMYNYGEFKSLNNNLEFSITSVDPENNHFNMISKTMDVELENATEQLSDYLSSMYNIQMEYLTTSLESYYRMRANPNQCSVFFKIHPDCKELYNRFKNSESEY